MSCVFCAIVAGEAPAIRIYEDDENLAILDPFGQRWTVMTRVEDFTPQERERRVAEWAATAGG